MIFLETKRLYLRNTMAGDEDVMVDYRNNEICSRYQKGQVRDFHSISDLVFRHRNDTFSVDAPFMVAAALKESNEMIGEIVVRPKDNILFIGYTFSYKYHRQGYGFEALSACIHTLHTMAPGWEFVSFTHPQNAASIGLLQKLDYRDYGYISAVESQVFGKWIDPERKFRKN